MSNVKLTNLQSKVAGQPTKFQDTNGVESGRLCRAWVNFNGTGTVAIRDSFNVASITDNGTGNYTVNFDVAMADANYSICGMGTQASGNAPFIVSKANETDLNVNGCNIILSQVSTRVDGNFICVQVFGE
jgi:hypothetical protein